MNTKIFIISIALIVMFPQSISVGASFQKQLLPVQNQTHIITPADNKHHNDKAMDWTFNWSFDDGVHHGHNQSGDDNKSHHFHYDRFFKNRKRILFSFLLKILLVIAHLSSLIYASINILH